MLCRSVIKKPLVRNIPSVFVRLKEFRCIRNSTGITILLPLAPLALDVCGIAASAYYSPGVRPLFTARIAKTSLSRVFAFTNEIGFHSLSGAFRHLPFRNPHHLWCGLRSFALAQKVPRRQYLGCWKQRDASKVEHVRRIARSDSASQRKLHVAFFGGFAWDY
jgi:hypothetical protein